MLTDDNYIHKVFTEYQAT